MARHMHILNRELTAVATGENDRLIVQMPPRHGKSYLTSVYFPAWYLGRWPDRHIIQVGADDELAKTFSIQARNILTEHGPSYFGSPVDPKSQAAGHWKMQAGGGLKAAGVGGTIVGFGADVLVIDDYIRNVEAALSEVQRRKMYQWYLTTAATRLSPNGAIVVVATRWHPHDLIGSVLADSEHTGEQWRVVSFPALGDDGAALWPERWDKTRLNRIRATHEASGYPWMWEALYQQNPPEILDSEWPQEFFGEDIWFDEWPDRKDTQIRVVALDPSLGRTDKADYSAFVCVAKSRGKYYVDADLSRRPPTQIVSDGMRLLGRWKPVAFASETNQFQVLLKDQFDAELRRIDSSIGTFGIRNDMNKLVRIRMLGTPLGHGDIRFRRGSPGVQLLIEQLKGFPAHRHDDGPDALEMGIRLANELLSGVPQALADRMGREERIVL